jgi:putative transcriptional regulator
MMAKNVHTIPADPDDPEDFAVGAEALERAQRSRLVRQVRHALGLSQAAFAARFGVPVGTLRDWEQARATPPAFAVAYMRLIREAPEMAARAAAS